MLLLCGLSALAFGQDDDSLFGSPEGPPPEGPPPEAPSTEAPPTEAPPTLDENAPRTSESDIAARLGLADQRVTFGGKLYLRSILYTVEDEAFGQSTVSSPNLFDLYADARPNDRVRGFVQGRFKYDFTVSDGDTDSFGNPKEPGSVTLDQLWLKFDLGRVVYVTTGRQRIKWGSGRFWNPTDFLNQQTLDALNVAVFDERTGVTLLKLHTPIEAIGANLYAVANFDGADSARQVGGAVRTEWVFATAELALSAAARRKDPLRLGADFTAGLGPFDVRVEGAVKHGHADPYYEGDLDIASFTFPTEVDRDDDWIPQVTAGAELGIAYGDNDTAYVGVEYFYNDAGYDDASLYPWLVFQAFDGVEGAYRPFYLGRHYAGAYVALPSPGRWDDGSITFSTLSNLSDKSIISRLDVSERILTFLSINGYTQVHYGDNGEFHYTWSLDPIPGVLDEGLEIPAPLVDVGVGATLAF